MAPSERSVRRGLRLLVPLLLVLQAVRGDLLADEMPELLAREAREAREAILEMRPLELRPLELRPLAGPARAAVAAVAAGVDVRTTLECHPRVYNTSVTRTDSNGRTCFDHISVTSCWGRCDSNEISDFRFPFKRSHHPVCIHDVREPRLIILRNCMEGVEPGTERFEYLEAKRCSCRACRSSEASCEGLRYSKNGQPGLPGQAQTVLEQLRQLPMVVSSRGDRDRDRE